MVSFSKILIDIRALFITEQADRLIFHSSDTDSWFLFFRAADLDFSLLWALGGAVDGILMLLGFHMLLVGGLGSKVFPRIF